MLTRYSEQDPKAQAAAEDLADEANKHQRLLSEDGRTEGEHAESRPYSGIEAPTHFVLDWRTC